MCGFAFLFHLCNVVVWFDRMEMTFALSVRISHSDPDGVTRIATSTTISSALVEDGNLQVCALKCVSCRPLVINNPRPMPFLRCGKSSSEPSVYIWILDQEEICSAILESSCLMFVLVSKTSSIILQIGFGVSIIMCTLEFWVSSNE